MDSSKEAAETPHSGEHATDPVMNALGAKFQNLHVTAENISTPLSNTAIEYSKRSDKAANTINSAGKIHDLSKSTTVDIERSLQNKKFRPMGEEPKEVAPNLVDFSNTGTQSAAAISEAKTREFMARFQRNLAEPKAGDAIIIENDHKPDGKSISHGSPFQKHFTSRSKRNPDSLGSIHIFRGRVDVAIQANPLITELDTFCTWARDFLKLDLVAYQKLCYSLESLRHKILKDAGKLNDLLDQKDSLKAHLDVKHLQEQALTTEIDRLRKGADYNPANDSQGAWHAKYVERCSCQGDIKQVEIELQKKQKAINSFQSFHEIEGCFIEPLRRLKEGSEIRENTGKALDADKQKSVAGIDELETIYDHAQLRVTQLEQELKSTREGKEQAENAVKQAQEEVKKRENQITKLRESLLDAQQTSAGQQEINRAKMEHQRAVDALNELNKFKYNTKSEFEILSRQLALLQAENKDLNIVIKNKKARIKDLERKLVTRGVFITDIPNSYEFTTEVERLQDEIQELTQRLEEQEDSSKQALKDAKEQIDDLKTKLQHKQELSSASIILAAPDGDNLKDLILSLKATLSLEEKDMENTKQKLADIGTELIKQQNNLQALRAPKQDKKIGPSPPVESMVDQAASKKPVALEERKAAQQQSHGTTRKRRSAEHQLELLPPSAENYNTNNPGSKKLKTQAFPILNITDPSKRNYASALRRARSPLPNSVRRTQQTRAANRQHVQRPHPLHLDDTSYTSGVEHASFGRTAESFEPQLRAAKERHNAQKK